MALKNLLEMKRTNDHFKRIWQDAEVRRQIFKADEAKLPRIRRAPRRIDEGGNATEFDSVEQYFRVQYFSLLDKVTASIMERFDSPAWKLMNSMESLLVKSCRGEPLSQNDIDVVLTHAAGDLNNQVLGQLAQLQNIPMSSEERSNLKSFSDILILFKKELATLRLLPQVVKLAKLICILPCSTATPERSFSQLRRIKNYMRSTMGQERLNHTMVAAVHSDVDIDVDKIMTDFIFRNEERRSVFSPVPC